VYNFGAALTLIRTLISGNTVLGLEPSEPAEVYNSGGGVVIANNFNMFGINGFARVLGFSPGATDLVPSVTLGAILDTTLAANGGSTFNHALVTGSPAIDAVTAGCPPPATDQRGVTRPQGYFCDIGAFEATVCGNGAAEGLEQCDDGNLVEGDGCSATCVLEFCGDGEVDVGEECDDGNTMSGDGCSEVCQIEPPLDPCATPSDGCKVNGVANQPCVGTEGNDTISGTGGADVILGGGGNDTLRGGGGDDVLCGEAGDDTLLGLAGNDRLVGGEDDDNLNGGVGHDELEGGGGNDRLTGAGGADTLRGDDGDDTLLAGPGSDVLDGGAGADHLNGGGGVDQCTTDGEDVLVKQCE
jgi:cysteine-rich repeat protein